MFVRNSENSVVAEQQPAINFPDYTVKDLISKIGLEERFINEWLESLNAFYVMLAGLENQQNQENADPQSIITWSTELASSLLYRSNELALEERKAIDEWLKAFVKCMNHNFDQNIKKDQEIIHDLTEKQDRLKSFTNGSNGKKVLAAAGVALGVVLTVGSSVSAVVLTVILIASAASSGMGGLVMLGVVVIVGLIAYELGIHLAVSSNHAYKHATSKKFKDTVEAGKKMTDAKIACSRNVLFKPSNTSKARQASNTTERVYPKLPMQKKRG